MFVSIGSYGDEEAVRCRGTKPEAQQIAEQSKGRRMDLLMSNYGKNEVTPRPVARVKSEAASNYHMSRGILYFIFDKPSLCGS